MFNVDKMSTPIEEDNNHKNYDGNNTKKRKLDNETKEIQKEEDNRTNDDQNEYNDPNYIPFVSEALKKY